MRSEPHGWRWRLGRHVGPEAVAATLTTIVVVVLGLVVWLVGGPGS